MCIVHCGMYGSVGHLSVVNNFYYFLAIPHSMQDLLFPNQGLNPGSLQWKRGVPATGPPGKSLEAVLGAPALAVTVGLDVPPF